MAADVFLPCPTCDPVVRMVVADDEPVIRCPGCGASSSFVRRPVFLVTGAPAAGKTTLVAALAGRLGGVPVFDTDMLGVFAQREWVDWANTWLLVAHGLATCGMPTVFCGYGLARSTIEPLEARALLGPIRSLFLDADAGELRARLRRRPAWANYDDARIERKLASADGLRREADDVIDITGMAPGAVVDAVESWLRAGLA